MEYNLKSPNEKIKEFIDDNKFYALFSIYLIAFIYLDIENPKWSNELIIVIPLCIASSGILLTLYFEKRESLTKLFTHSITKWGFTVFIYSICLWYAQLRLNTTYGIQLESLHYSSLAYAFLLSFPMAGMVAGLLMFLFFMVREISVVRLVFSSLVSAFLLPSLFENMPAHTDIESLIIMAVIIVVFYNLSFLLPFLKSKEKRNLIHSAQSLITSLAVLVALFLLSVSLMSLLDKFQGKLLFLDAHVATVCSSADAHTLYIIKDDTFCYKVSGNALSQMKLELVPKLAQQKRDE